MTDMQDQPSGESQRQMLAKTIRSFLNEEIDSWVFEDHLDTFYDSEDPIIQHVCSDLWYIYDDIVDHQLRLTKTDWDYMQRLLLLLESNCEIELKDESMRRWSIRQTFAGGAVLAFAILALQLGISWYLLLLALPFGLISILLATWKTRNAEIDDPYEPIIFPFATISDLERAYRSTNFRKTQYPKHVAERCKTTWLMEVNQQFQVYLYWLVFSPIVLLFQTWPEYNYRVRIYAS